MPPARESRHAWILFAFGAAFVAMGWGFRALALRLFPEVDAGSFGVGALVVGSAAGLAAFAVGRWWRPIHQRREEQIRQGVLAHAAQSIISTDADGLIETFSRGAERLLGVSARNVVGKLEFHVFLDSVELRTCASELSQELGRDVLPQFDAIVVKARESAEPKERDWTLVRGDGSRVAVRVSVTPMRDRRARITGFLMILSDLTEHKLAEERRRESAVRLRKIASQVPGMVFQFKQAPDGRRCFPYASEGIREIYRVEPEAVAQDAAIIWDCIHPEDIERMAESIDHSARTLERWHCEYRTRFASGDIRWLYGTALPEPQPDGAILWHGFITDITERKRADQAHEESRVLLQSVFSSVDLAVFVVDVTTGGDFRFVEVNPSYERLTGIGAAEIRGRGPHELVPLIPAEMAECLRSSFRRGVESTGPIEYEEPFFVRNRLLWWLTRLTPLRDSVGNVVRLVGRSFDITERKNIEFRFQSLTERLQLATEAAQVGIWDLDLTQNQFVWDKRMQALYGFTASDFDGSYAAWRERLHPDDVERVEREQQDAMDDRQPFNTSFRIVRRDGEEREIRACAHVQRNPAGRAIRMVGVNWDVTAERQAQAEIVRARDEAEHLNRRLKDALARSESFAREAEAATIAKSEFLANMSHEIRTPLNAVIGMSGLLLSADLTKEQREFAETIRSSGDGLLALINDILDYSKIESGKLDLEQQSFDLRDCVESALDVLATRAAEKKIDLLCAIEPGVPEAIVGDVTRLRQVMVNLLSNAVKFTAAGEVFLAVAASSPAGGRMRLRFAVHDSGIGIPPERMDRLFKTFSQVDASTTRQYGGTGLGLAISKRIVEMMGGKIWFESSVGRGSIFYFDVDAVVAPAPAKRFASGRVVAMAGRRVLIVDDNATGCRVLCQQMLEWGLVPRAVASGADAQALLVQDARYDLVLADMEMPGMSGLELAAQIRLKHPPSELPIALLTWPGVGRLSPDLGIMGCLNKPVKPALLFELLMEALHGRQATPTAKKPEHALAEEHPLTILLAEDNMVNQRVATLMLQRMGYRADVAMNGREALDAVSRKKYDLVLMDVQMPEMDGVQATREICARWPAGSRPRIVAMTANASMGDREVCLAAGMNDFLTKPVRVADLRRALQETPPRYVASAA